MQATRSNSQSTYCMSIEMVLLEHWSDFVSPLGFSITSRLTVGRRKALKAVNGMCDARTRGHWKSGFWSGVN